MDKATRSALSKAGAFVRRTARSSMKSRQGKKAGSYSAPGTPPNVHAGQLKDLLFFGFDPGNRSVVIGPVPFGKGEAPNLEEFGGSVPRRGRRGVVKVAKYPARPFMGPALQKEIPQMPARWANAVKSS